MSTNPQEYFTLLTPAGAAAFANAPRSGTMVNLSHLAVGDGGGSPVEPSETMAELVNEVHRVPITSVTIDPQNPNWLVIEAVIPANVGGWTIRETGVIGGDQFLSIGNFPATYKPFLAQGAAKELTVRMIVQVSNAGAASMSVDPSVTVLTQQGLANALQAYYTKAQADGLFITATEADTRYLQSVPLASSTVSGLVELATLTETRAGTDTSRAVTPAGLKGLFNDHGDDPDPHKQYMTRAKTEQLLTPAIEEAETQLIEKITVSLAIVQFEQGAY